jgi:hypothetical protein
VEKDVIRQFVAAPMDRGITVEEQLTAESRWGGIQLLAFPMKAERYRELWANWASPCALREDPDVFLSREERRLDLGLAPGGRMRQAIYDDPHDISVSDQEHGSRCFITIVDSVSWTAITGESMPTSPVHAAKYTAAGLPWFDYYSDTPAIAGSNLLNSLESVAKTWIGPSQAGLFDKPISPPRVQQLGRRPVREMRE